MKDISPFPVLRRGFTLLEMLIVIGIIATLAGVMMGGGMAIRKKAWNAKAQDLVSSAATAISSILVTDGAWPVYLLKGAAAGDPKLDVDACQPLAAKKLFSLSYLENERDGATYYELRGQDRCGIADPWAADVLRRLDPKVAGSAALSRAATSGGAAGTVEDHLLRFAIDDDFDGIVEARVGGSVVKVRASAVVWCAGADGKFAPYSKVGHSDDVYSWSPNQVDR